MYYFISNTDDGLYIHGPLNQDAALERINELTSEDIRPEYRAVFIETLPDPYTPPEHVCIIKGDVVVPAAMQRVTEWSL